MPDHTDAELCSMLAELLGLEPVAGAGGTTLWKPGGADCETAWYFDPLTSWEDFGRVWEWAYMRGLSPSIYEGINVSMSGAGTYGVEGREFSGPRPQGDARRALVIAILRARGRI